MKNCLTCKWEPDWDILRADPGYKSGVCEFPWPENIPVCDEWKAHNVFRQNRTKKVFVPAMNFKEITNCHAWQTKE